MNTSIVWSVYIVIIYLIIFYFWSLNCYRSGHYKSKAVHKYDWFGGVETKAAFLSDFLLILFFGLWEKSVKKHNDKIDAANIDNKKINRYKRLPWWLWMITFFFIAVTATYDVPMIHRLLPYKDDFFRAMMLMPLIFLSLILFFYMITFLFMWLGKCWTIRHLTIRKSKKLKAYKDRTTLKKMFFEIINVEFTPLYTTTLKWISLFIIFQIVYVITIINLFNAVTN